MRSCKMKGYAILAASIAAAIALTGCTGGPRKPPETSPIAVNQEPSGMTTAGYLDLKKEWSTMTVDRYVTRFAELVKDTWGKMDRIWPGIDYSTFNVALRSGDQAWIIQGGTGERRSIPVKDLPEIYQDYEGLYLPPDQAKIDGVPTMLVTMDPGTFKKPYDTSEFESLPSASFLYVATVHETFHYAQSGWIGEQEEEQVSRNTKYPLNTEARYLRVAIMHHLREAVLHPDDQRTHLQHVRWYYDQMMSKQKEEADAIRIFDLFEGTARYVDMTANARSVVGWDATAAEMDQVYRKMMEMDYPIEGRYDGQSDSESYDIGGAAGVLLARQGHAIWMEDAERGIPPLDAFH